MTLTANAMSRRAGLQPRTLGQTWGLLVALASALALGACRAGSPAAAAPSFDCAKATTTVEKTICANPDVARLDSRLAAAWKLIGTGLADEAKPSLRSSEQAWLGQRNACTDATCLRTHYQARLAELGAAPDIDPYPGRFRMADIGELVIFRVGADDYRIVITTSDPKSGAWTCEFAGRGQRHGESLDATDGSVVVQLRVTPQGTMQIPANGGNLDADSALCGLNGFVSGDYARIQP